MASFKLQHSHALIFGGPWGVGLAIAQAALEQGARVTLSSSDETWLQNSVAKLRQVYPARAAQISGYPCDISGSVNPELNLERLLRHVTAQQKIDHIVFDAEEFPRPPTPLYEITYSKILSMGCSCFLGAVFLAKLATRYMNIESQCSITLSNHSDGPWPKKDRSIQAAWTSAIEGVARGLAVDLAPIRVNLVSASGIFVEGMEGLQEASLQAALQGYRNTNLLDKFGMPDEVAEAYIYLMRSSFATGSLVRVDGGKFIHQ